MVPRPPDPERRSLEAIEGILNAGRVAPAIPIWESREIAPARFELASQAFLRPGRTAKGPQA